MRLTYQKGKKKGLCCSVTLALPMVLSICSFFCCFETSSIFRVQCFFFSITFSCLYPVTWIAILKCCLWDTVLFGLSFIQPLILFLSSDSPDDWECFLHYLGCLLEDDTNWSNGVPNDPIPLSKYMDCKLSHLKEEVVCAIALYVWSFFHISISILLWPVVQSLISPNWCSLILVCQKH